MTEKQLVEIAELTAVCILNLDVGEWWRIGGRMHTITDDHKILYDYDIAKSYLDPMWKAWVDCDPRPKDEQ